LWDPASAGLRHYGTLWDPASGGLRIALRRTRFGDHPFDAIDVADAQRAGAVGGDALRQRHAAAARAAGGVCRLERGPLLLRGEVGEIDHAEVPVAVGNARHLGDAV